MSNFSQFFSRGNIPIGGIIMWSGSIDSIPTDWALCDGSNNTPNLKDRFVVGAGNGYNPGDTGGENTVTLNINQIPSHDHLVYGQDNNAVATGNVSNEVANVASRGSGNAFFSRTTSLSGGGQAHENRPPYYALAFIMRIA